MLANQAILKMYDSTSNAVRFADSLPRVAAGKSRIARTRVDLAPGTPIGNYILDRKLAEGGMACVYEAHHLFLPRPVALKVVHPRNGEGAQVDERLLQEAQLLAILEHPGLVRVHDFGYLVDGRPWMAMELLTGRTLAERLADAPMEALDAIDLLRRIAGPLATAHHHGIIHRDLKPDNVFLCDDGRVKVVDWGIAYVSPGEGRSRLTRTGLVVGTPAYMAPEQARGIDCDSRADVYALGIVAYELFAKAVPFAGDSALDILVQHITLPPPAMRTAWPGIPVRLERLIMAMLNKSPAQRPPIELVDLELAAIRAELVDTGMSGADLRLVASSDGDCEILVVEEAAIEDEDDDDSEDLDTATDDLIQALAGGLGYGAMTEMRFATAQAAC
jgi:serine/threonine protein kinase